jgi:hypothetical protein
VISQHETSLGNFLFGLRKLPAGFTIPGTTLKIFTGCIAYIQLMKEGVFPFDIEPSLHCADDTIILYDKENGLIGSFLDLSLIDVVHDEDRDGPYEGSFQSSNDDARNVSSSLKNKVDKITELALQDAANNNNNNNNNGNDSN